MSYPADIFPTHLYAEYQIRLGIHLPFGATLVRGGINFSIYSFHASICTLVLFKKGCDQPFIEIPYQGYFHTINGHQPTWGDFRIGKLFTMIVFNLNHDEIEYGFRLDGDFVKAEYGKPGHHRFDPSKVLLDPYAKAISGREVWKKGDVNWVPRGRIVQDDYNWESDRQLETPMEELIIYEMHARGFTSHPSSHVKYPGTFNGILEKIPYLKDLGINCIELMPIAEFDEFENYRVNPETKEMTLNYWGYSPMGFFAPKAGYAACGKFKDGTMVADELKTLIKTLHQNGIEIILDVVFNHTREGNEYGPTLSFKGIDNLTYYLLTPEGWYYNFSGTGNTLNCNNPIVRNFLLDCLRYWVAEFHIDGFRFDLAAILGRDPFGVPLPNPPLLEMLSYDPILAKCKLIAESWDAAGLYQVGRFPAYGRWAEWNGKYRDTIRKFIKGDFGMVSHVAECLMGSPNLYQSYQKNASINFITCHDGFTLFDLVSYDYKHNEANLENNEDGENNNNSCNYGTEGPTTQLETLILRKKQIKNFITLLMISRGVPMILMGDEMGRTQRGNNNAYCHDNDLTWLDWDLLNQNGDIFRFLKYSIAFRKKHSVLTKSDGSPVEWNCDWSMFNRTLAVRLFSNEKSDVYSIYVVINMGPALHTFHLPVIDKARSWHVFINTGKSHEEEIWPPGEEVLLKDSEEFLLDAKSICILVEKGNHYASKDKF